MPFSKNLYKNAEISVDVSEAGGQVTLSQTLNSQALIDAGLVAAAGKFPQFASEINALKALFDAEISKA